MQKEQSCHNIGETGVQKQANSVFTVHAHSNDHRVRMPSQSRRTYVISAGILPSKFETIPGRPLPPLQRPGLAVQKSDDRTSFKPAKSSDRRNQPTLPVKGLHAAAHNSTETASRLVKVQAGTDHEAQCIESKDAATVDDCDPAKLQRSDSVSRFSLMSSVSSDTKPRKLSRSPSVSSCARHSRSVDRNVDTALNGQVSSESVFNSKKSGSAEPQISRRRSSSVSSSARVPLQRINPSRTLSPLTSGRGNMLNGNNDLALTEGKQRHSSAKENCLKASDRIVTAKSRDDSERLASDRHRAQTAEQPLAVCSQSLQQHVAGIHLHKAKPLEKSSSSHGILGGKSDEDEFVTATTADGEQKSLSPSTSQQSSVVRVNYYC